MIFFFLQKICQFVSLVPVKKPSLGLGQCSSFFTGLISIVDVQTLFYKLQASSLGNVWTGHYIKEQTGIVCFAQTLGFGQTLYQF